VSLRKQQQELVAKEAAGIFASVGLHRRNVKQWGCYYEPNSHTGELWIIMAMIQAQYMREKLLKLSHIDYEKS